MIKLKIALDLDGVSANFNKGVCEIFDKLKIPYKQINSKEDITHWYFEDHMGVSKEQVNLMWREIEKSKMFWLNLNLIDPEGWKLLVEKLANREDIELYFITARTLGKNLREQTFKWLHLQGIKYPTLIFCPEKISLINSLGANYCIDDSPSFFKELKEELYPQTLGNLTPLDECKFFKYDYPYNRDIHGFDKVKDLKEFVEIIIKEHKL